MTTPLPMNVVPFGDGSAPTHNIMSSPVVQQQVQQHPYFYTYNDFQQPYGYWNFQHNGNNPSISYKNIEGEFPVNSNYRYAAGFTPNERFISFYCDKSIQYMSAMITHYLKGVHPEGKNITVPEATIKSVADSIFQNTHASVQVMQEMVVNYIVQYIKDEYETTNKNNKLSIWVTKYDQETGLKQFNDVKLNAKGRPSYFQWRY